ncbi:MAG: alpha/beta fold hydrolase [Chloroflexota bacterium]
MPYANVNDLRLYYEESGEGTPLILMHGASSSIDDPVFSWLDLVPSFSERYRAIQVEHRGHGRTDNPAGRLDYHLIAGDICALIEQLGAGPAHVAGVSDGGIVALTIGMTRPDLARSLVAVGPNYYNDDLVREANEFADVSRMSPRAIEAMAARHDRGGKPAGWWKDLFAQLAANLAVNPDYSLADLARIPNPVLLVSGEDDLWGNIAQMTEMKRAIPNAELLIVNHAPHEVQHTHPWIVGPQVLDFLARHP